jgi:hypothetical protein
LLPLFSPWHRFLCIVADKIRLFCGLTIRNTSSPYEMRTFTQAIPTGPAQSGEGRAVVAREGDEAFTVLIRTNADVLDVQAR